MLTILHLMGDANHAVQSLLQFCPVRLFVRHCRILLKLLCIYNRHVFLRDASQSVILAVIEMSARPSVRLSVTVS